MPALLRMTSLALLLLASAAVSAARADDTSCVIEGTMVLDGKPVPTKDCFENLSARPDDFQRVCDAMIQTARAVTKATGMPPPEVGFGKACPPGAVATCKGFLHMPIVNHHYPRSAHELEVARESCLTQGGEWKK